MKHKGITDGDIRQYQTKGYSQTNTKNIMSPSPILLEEEVLAVKH